MQGLRRIYAAPGGWWSAMEHGGLMRYDSSKRTWTQSGKLTPETAATLREFGGTQARKKAPAQENVAACCGSLLNEPVNDMGFADTAWFAATNHGLLRSEDHGENWALMPLGPLPTLPVRSVRVSADGESLWIVSLRGMVFSHDAGKTWSWHDLPESAGSALWLDSARGLPVRTQRRCEVGEETLVASAENGLYISRDSGAKWNRSRLRIAASADSGFGDCRFDFLASMKNRRTLSFTRRRTHLDARVGRIGRRIFSGRDDGGAGEHFVRGLGDGRTIRRAICRQVTSAQRDGKSRRRTDIVGSLRLDRLAVFDKCLRIKGRCTAQVPILEHVPCSHSAIAQNYDFIRLECAKVNLTLIPTLVLTSSSLQRVVPAKALRFNH